jgi:outer membrane protein assembly factor BamB
MRVMKAMGVCIKHILPLFISLVCFFSVPSCSPNQAALSGEEPVEPLVTGKETLLGEPFLRGRFSVLNPEMKVFTLSVSHNGANILFSSECRTISYLDDQGNLCWEITTEGLPICAALTEDGRFVGVGTDQGKVYFLSDAGHVLWETSFPGKIEHLIFNKRADEMVLSVSEEERDTLCCLNRWGSLLWEMETGPLRDLYPAAGKEICYLEENGSDGGIFKVIRGGELLWEKETQLAAVSIEGNILALYDGDELQYYCLEMDGCPRLAWSFQPGSEQEISWLGLTAGGRYLLAYNAIAVRNNNLWAFGNDGMFLWERRIPSGALLDFSASGERIVATSWQEYSEDVSKIIILNNYGHILQEIEMANRIENNALSGDGNILVLAGGDGNIFILETFAQGDPIKYNGFTEEGEQAKTIYQPVAFEKQAGKTFLTLFFFGEGGLNFIPINRSVKVSPQAPQAAINELIKGPRSYSGLSRTIPKDVQIGVMEKDGLAYVDLPASLNKLGGTSQVGGLLDSLVMTLSQFSSVQGIQFLLEGEKATVFSAEGFMIDQVFPPSRPGKNHLLYLPYRCGDRYYLLPRETEGTLGPTDLVNAVLQESYPFLLTVPCLKEISVQEREILLNWDASLVELFPQDGGAKEKALAALFTDALLLTLLENLPADQLVFLVEGELWEPPESYHFSGKINRPFFINPE